MGWKARVIPACLIAILTALVWSPYDIDHPLPGGGFHRVSRGGPRLELSDVPVHDVDLAAPPGDEHGDSVNPAARVRARRAVDSSPQWLDSHRSRLGPDNTVGGAVQSHDQVLRLAVPQTPRGRAPPTF